MECTKILVHASIFYIFYIQKVYIQTYFKNYIISFASLCFLLGFPYNGV